MEPRPNPTHFFSEEVERDLAADDSIAWNRVTGILLAIVSIGVLLGAFSVLIIAG